MKQKKIIGITGGVGAGKSSVLAVLKNDFGAKIILADLVAHDLMEPEVWDSERSQRRLERHFSPRTEPWTEKRWRT